VIAFNRYGHRRGKLFSRSRAIQLIREINRAYKEAAIVLLCSPATKDETIRIQHELELANVYAATSTRTIRDSAAILYHADLVVTPDTSIVHIACAFDKPQICVYRDRTELKLWRPMSDKAIVLLPQSPSRHVDDVNLAEFSEALEKARAWLPPHLVEQ
jgi:ADP-heptose:LPS heptosyltransferase